jgi:hypothetical protein
MTDEFDICIISAHLLAIYYLRNKVPNFIVFDLPCHVKWVPCHHGMARPRVADSGDGLQIWRVAANMLNKQARDNRQGEALQLGGWAGANNPSTVKKLYMLRSIYNRLGTGRILWHDQRTRKWIS